ncbi:MAG TPA: hypothetical protein VF145_01520 [Chitinophagaceae bacterium]
MNINSKAAHSTGDQPACRDNIRHLSVYLYPQTPFLLRPGSNDYIFRLKAELNKDFKVVNGITRLGLLDLLLKLHRCDVVYFNWIEDVSDKRLGFLQVLLLFLILCTCKLTGIRIAWFVHNNVSHRRKNWRTKQLVRKMMAGFSDHIFSHSTTPDLPGETELKVFDHPVEALRSQVTGNSYRYDLLIWGSVSRYKGVADFVRFCHDHNYLRNLRIHIAGAFAGEELYEDVMNYRTENITVVNKVHSEQELAALFSESRYILFCYQSDSVLASAALCHSLSYGKTVIGPDRGAFRDLQGKGLAFTYRSFHELPELLADMKAANIYVNQDKLDDYIRRTGWQQFGNFLRDELSGTAVAEPVTQRTAEAIL